MLPQWYQKLHKAKYKDVDHISVSKEHLRIQEAMTEQLKERDKVDNFIKTHLIIWKVHSTYSLYIMNLSTGLLKVKDMQSRYTRRDVIYHSMRIFMEAVLRKHDKVVHKWYGLKQSEYSTQSYKSNKCTSYATKRQNNW